MASVRPGSETYDPSLWQTKEIERINASPDSDVLAELQRIMDGYDYSWHTINQALQDQLNEGTLEFTLEHGDVIFEWNNLCEERRGWLKRTCFSESDAAFHRDCLINLKILPVRAGLGKYPETSSVHRTNCGLAPHLATITLDAPGLSDKALGVEPTWWEDLSSYEQLGSQTGDGDWSPRSDADDSDYGDEEYDAEYYYGSEVEDDILPPASWAEDEWQ